MRALSLRSDRRCRAFLRHAIWCRRPPVEVPLSVALVDRYYDPATGQFLTVDPDVSETGEPYAYTDGDPANASDPTGACAWCILDPWSGANPIRLGAESDPTGIGTTLVEKFDPAYQAVQGFATGNYLEAAQGVVGTALFALGGAEAVGGIADVLASSGVDAAEEEGAASVVDETGDGSLRTVRHYTDDLGRSQIEAAGNLRAGTYVTLPEEFSAGTSSEGVEKLLEIEAGKGANFIDIQVPTSSLGIPENGPLTSGGLWQRILLNPVDLGAAEF
jgi:hypothetical protein